MIGFSLKPTLKSLLLSNVTDKLKAASVKPKRRILNSCGVLNNLLEIKEGRFTKIATVYLQ